jgi:transcriptional regulator with XRE-family HTH domain
MPQDPSLPIGAVLREIRESRGLTQTELGKQTGIDARTITAIEKGRISTPSLINLKKLAGALNTNLKEIFGRLEAKLPEAFHLGTQRGEFTVEYPKYRFRILSYLPRQTPFFAGKVILEAKGRMDSSAIALPGFAFVQMVFGRIELHLEGKEHTLKEGQNVLFNGRLEYSLSNPLIRESTAFLVSVPSFLSGQR